MGNLLRILICEKSIVDAPVNPRRCHFREVASIFVVNRVRVCKDMERPEPVIWFVL